MSEDWDSARYAREKRNFIESRSRFRSVYGHAVLIFAVTWLAGWLCSFLMLKSGVYSLAGRYAVSFVVSYLVFMGVVRVWASLMRTERSGGHSDGGWDVPDFSDAEGWAVVLAALALGAVLAGLFALVGGLPMLLEVAFEVVFAGVVVRRMSRREQVGDWASHLVRKTWLPALLSLGLLVGLAAVLQAKAPESRTFAEAVRALRMPAQH